MGVTDRPCCARLLLSRHSLRRPRSPRSTGIVMQQANPMSSAVAEFAEKAPELASRGLDVNQWGPLAYAGMGQVITNERAIILVAHIHVLFVSIVCAFAPLSFQDTLVKEKGYTPEAPAGLIPAFKTGLTPEAELINGRLAMFGLMALVWGSFGTGTPILDCINIGLGRILY